MCVLSPVMSPSIGHLFLYQQLLLLPKGNTILHRLSLLVRSTCICSSVSSPSTPHFHQLSSLRILISATFRFHSKKYMKKIQIKGTLIFDDSVYL